jgi:hypothetical protein
MGTVLLMAVAVSPAGAQSDTTPPDANKPKANTGTQTKFVPLVPSETGRPWQGQPPRGQDNAAVAGFAAGALLSTAASLVKGRKPAPAMGPVDPSRPVRAAEAPSSYRAETDDEAAVHACAKAIEDEGRRSFALAQVGQVHTARPLGNGYEVQGDVLLRTSYREAGVARGFRCRVDAQAVRMAAIDPLQTVPAR